MSTAKYIFRLATAADEPAVRDLQTRFIAEMNDPLGIDENARPYTQFFVVEAEDQAGGHIVGIMGLRRPSRFSFVFEQVFPEAWRPAGLPAWLDPLGIGRGDIVESDWGYIEKSHRGRGLAILLLAGVLLYARDRGYRACMAMPNDAFKARHPPAIFHATGLEKHLAGVRYELILHLLAEIATTMSELVRAARLRDPRIVWLLPEGDAAE